MKNFDVAAPLGRWVAGGMLAALSFHGPAQAQTPALASTVPAAGSSGVGRYAVVQAQFAAATPIGSASAAGLKVFSRQRGGQRAGTMGPVSAGNTGLSYNPGALGVAYNFQAGEEVQVSLTPAVVSAGGTPLAPPAVFAFTTETDGSGRGNFRPGSDLFLGTGIGAVVVADLDGDGDLDLATANQSTATVTTALNTGPGTSIFGGGSTVAVPGGTRTLAVADVDSDGDLDLLAVDASTTATLTVLRNNGSGTFALGPTTTIYNNPTHLAVGDLDGDGDLDVVADSGQGYLVSIRLNDGTGTFDNPPYPGGIGPGGQPTCLALADVDHDHDLDLVVAVTSGSSTASLAVLLNGGNASGSNTGVFGAPTLVQLNMSVASLTVNDLNGDAAADVVLVGNDNFSSGAPTTAVQFNNGSGSFGTGVRFGCAPDPQAVALGDVDADGDLDIVTLGGNPVAGTAGSLYTYFNSPTGFSNAARRTAAVGNGAIGLALADVDHDGDLDALSANQSAGTVSVRLNGPVVPPTLRVTLGPPATGTVYASGSTYTFPVTAVGGSAPQADFYVENTGDDPLTLGQPGTGAGTGTAGVQPGLGSNYGSGSLSVAPGQSLPLAFFYGVYGPTAAGAGTLQATFSTNDPTQLAYTLTMAGSTMAALPDLVVNSLVQLPGTISYGGPYRNVTVTSTGYLELATDLEVRGAMVVQSGGYFNTGNAPAGGTAYAVTGTGTFRLEDGATIAVRQAAGLGAGGAVQVSGTRTFDPGAAYIYNAFPPTAQQTGAGLPAQVRRLIGGSNGSPLTLTQPVAVTELLRVGDGDVLTNGHALTLRSDASGTAVLWNGGTGRVVGDATVERYNSSPYRGTGYRHYSAPVSNATVGSLATAGFTPVVNPAYNTVGNTVRPFPTVFAYAQDVVFDHGWYSPLALTDQLVPGIGYTVQLPASEKVRFTGPLNQNLLSVGLASNTDPAGAWYLLGNPFPSPIDWGTLTTGTGFQDNLTNVGTAVYVFEASGPYTGTYRTAVAGVGGSPVIASGQGFFVRTAPPGQPFYGFSLFNRNRVTTFNAGNNTFHRAAETRPLLTLALRDAAGASDPASIYFTPAATSAFDLTADAAKLPNTTGLNLATRLGGADYAINGLPVLGTAPLVLPLTVQVPAAGNYALAVDRLVNFAPGTALYLRDALLGTLTLLTATTRYAFALAGTSAPSRFSVEFRPAGALASAAQVLEAQVAVWPNPAAGSTGVTVAAPAGASVGLCNALGQAVGPVVVVGASGRLRLPTAGLAAGLYVLRVGTAAGSASRRLVLE